MSILTIQFGQCGNQVGHSLFNYLVNDINYEPENKKITVKTNSDYKQRALTRWFCGNKKGDNFIPRSILVDTEDKVISSITKDKSLLKYKNIIAKSDGGSANNWANGYFAKNDIIGDVLELMRREVEKCDEIINIFTILSSGGGTGSGLGSSIIEKIRDEYENKIILNSIILPYNEGEVVTQNYNTLLTLAKLYDISDGSIIFENANLHKTCTELLSIKDVKISNINSLISQKVAALLQPAEGQTISNITQLTSHPNYKLIQIKTAPHIPEECVKFEVVQTWPNLISRIRNVLRVQKYSHAPMSLNPKSQYCKAVGGLLISRGGESPNSRDLEGLNDSELYASWLPKANRLTHYHSERNLYNTGNFLTFASNNSSVYYTIENIVAEAWNLYNYKAFLHQYEQFGISSDEFDEAFMKLESILQSYKSL